MQGGGKGRPAYYFVPDQLFCTWYQMRYLHPHRRRIEMFLEVLRTWFKAEERLEMVKSVVATASGFRGGPLVSAAVAAEYYAASLAKTEHGRAAADLAVKMWLKTENLPEAAFALAELRDLRGDDRRLYEASAYAGLAKWAEEQGDVATAIEALRVAVERDPINIETRLRYGMAVGDRGEYGLAFECFDEVVRVATDPRVTSAALVFRGITREHQGDTSGAMTDYAAVVGLEGALRESVVAALFNRATIREQLGDASRAIADYTALVELDRASSEEVARALLNRGIARERQGDMSGAVSDYTAVVKLEGAPREQVVRTLVRRGTAMAQQGNTMGAIADYTAVVELEAAPREAMAGALILRGVARQTQGDTVGAIVDYTAVVELEGAPREAVAAARVNRGAIRKQQGDVPGAIADYTAVMELEGVPRELMVRALVSRGTARAQQNDTPGAIADYTAVVKVKGVPHEALAEALYNRGVVRGEHGDGSGALADFTAVVELEGAPREEVAMALLNRGVVRKQDGDVSGAIADWTAVVELQDVPREEVAAALVNRGVARRQLGDPQGAIRDLTTAVDLSEVESEVQAIAMINRAQAYVSLGQSDRAFEDSIAVAGNTLCAAPLRMWSFAAAVRVSPLDQDRVERVCSKAKAFVTSFVPEQQRECIVGLLSGLSSPETASVWLRIWRAVSRDQPQDVLSSLAFLDAVADVLEGRERSVLNPLPPEQREFAEEILRKLQPSDAVLVSGSTGRQ